MSFEFNGGNVSTSVSYIEPDQLYAAYLENGGSNDMAVNGSVTEQTFSTTVAAGKTVLLRRILFYLDSDTAWSDTNFTHLAPLTNGVQLNVGGVQLAVAKDNVDFVAATFDFEGRKNMAKETKSGAGRWTFTNAAGAPLIVRAGETIEAVIRDNLTGVGIFRMQAQGCIMDE